MNEHGRRHTFPPYTLRQRNGQQERAREQEIETAGESKRARDRERGTSGREKNILQKLGLMSQGIEREYVTEAGRHIDQHRHTLTKWYASHSPHMPRTHNAHSNSTCMTKSQTHTKIPRGRRHKGSQKDTYVHEHVHVFEIIMLTRKNESRHTYLPTN